MTTLRRTLIVLAATALTAVALTGCVPSENRVVNNTHTAPQGPEVITPSTIDGHLGLTLSGWEMRPNGAGRFTVPIPLNVDPDYINTTLVVCSMPDTLLDAAKIKAHDKTLKDADALTRFFDTQTSAKPRQIIDSTDWFYLPVTGQDVRVQLESAQRIEFFEQPDGSHQVIVTVGALTSSSGSDGLGFWYNCGGQIDKRMTSEQITAAVQTSVIDHLHEYLTQKLAVTVNDTAQKKIVDATTMPGAQG